MAIFKKEIKRFDYKTRYYKGEGNPYEVKHKFDKFRTTVGKNKGLKAKFNSAMDDLKASNYKLNKTILLIVGVLIVVFLYIIDFDLSIFLPKK